MKNIFLLITVLLSTLTSYAQCNDFKVDTNPYITTTNTKDRIDEFALNKITYNENVPVVNLIYLFINVEGGYITNDSIAHLTKAQNVVFYFDDNTTLSLRSFIDVKYSIKDDVYNYSSVIYLTEDYLNTFKNKKVTYYEIFSFRRDLSDRISLKLYDYINCMSN